MQRESKTARLEAGPNIRPILIRRFNPEQLTVEPLHPFQIFYVKHCAA